MPARRVASRRAAALYARPPVPLAPPGGRPRRPRATRATTTFPPMFASLHAWHLGRAGSGGTGAMYERGAFSPAPEAEPAPRTPSTRPLCRARPPVLRGRARMGRCCLGVACSTRRPFLRRPRHAPARGRASARCDVPGRSRGLCVPRPSPAASRGCSPDAVWRLGPPALEFLPPRRVPRVPLRAASRLFVCGERLLGGRPHALHRLPRARGNSTG